MAKRYSTADFIEKAISKHGNYYDYSKVEYNGSKPKVIIGCPKGHTFTQSPSDHLQGKGCSYCGGTKRMTTQDFILKSKAIHGDDFSYESVDYKTNKKAVLITCNKCKRTFKQKPSDNLSGCGCRYCANKADLDLSEFIRRSKVHHGDKYNYSKSVYIGSVNQIIITCPIHGDYSQRSHYHMIGRGCYECERVPQDWSKSGYIKTCEKYGGLSELYIIDCYLDGERFYKIGITTRGVENRHRYSEYDYDLVSVVEGEAGFIWDLEKRLHKLNDHNHYKPSMKFVGSTECFSKIPKSILRLLDGMNNSKQLQLLA